MKLSELLKNNPEVLSSPSVTPPLPVPKPRRLETAPLPSAEDFEKKIRAGIENEFTEKLHKMEEDLMRMTEEQLRAQQDLKESREKALEAEKLRMAEELKDLKTANENLASAQSKQEEEFQQRLALERERFQKELRDKIQESAQKIADESKKKQEALEKQKQAEEASREIISPAPEIPQAPPAAIAPEKIPEKKSEAAPVETVPAETPQQSTPSFYPVPPPLQSFPNPSPVPPEVFILDSKTEEKLRKIYQVMAQAGEHVFEKLLRSGIFEGDYLKKILGDIYDLMEKHDQDFLTIVLEPYPSTDYFTFHAANCAILSIIIGQELKLPAEEVKELALASFLHDVGLLGIRENLDYPKPLTAVLKTEILKHPERGAALLGDNVSPEIINAILQHHENMSGKGYPKGLTENEIHPYAKIMQIVDAFEAMTHHRPYRQKPLEVSEALREMVDRGRGIYDRSSMKALMSRIGLYPVLSLVELSNHKIARVMRQSRKFPLSPVVRIEFDEDGNKLREAFLIDLSKNQLIHIHGPVGSSHSYGKDRIEKQTAEPKRSFRVWEIIPFLLVVVILAVVAYLILKL